MSKIFYYVGVDVGTGSARAAVVSNHGAVEHQAVEPIQTWNPVRHHFEQSSDDIWRAVCKVVKKVVEEVDTGLIRGIGFDATCSLVIIGEKDEPLTVSTTGAAEQNVILWMDHRAEEETVTINSTHHPVLDYVGGQLSVEMELPKLLWLKNNIPDTYNNIFRAFDLSDFLTWRATDAETRSLCSVICKWNYDSEKDNFSTEFMRQIGLEELTKNAFIKIGKEVATPGTPVGTGLSQAAAEELGLPCGLAVGTSLIDAHAGALAMFSCRSEEDDPTDCHCTKPGVVSKLAIIAGSSTCVMSMTKTPTHAKGIWGPYKDVILPNYYLNEAGQSVAGLLLDYIIQTHPAYPELKEKFPEDKDIYPYLNELLQKKADECELENVAYLTSDLHVWPDFHGNRSPIADPNLRGMISGLGMSKTEDSLALLYLATIQSLAYGTRLVIDTLMKAERPRFAYLVFTGGLAKNPLYVMSHVDVCQLTAIIPNEPEMVLVGAAILGAAAGGPFKSIESAARALGGEGPEMKPNEETASYHDQKYRVFIEMVKDQRKYQRIMLGQCQ